jgi:hypothetical protein
MCNSHQSCNAIVVEHNWCQLAQLWYNDYGSYGSFHSRSVEDDSAKSKIHNNFLDLQILVGMTRNENFVVVQLSGKEELSNFGIQ